jgi:putative Holliday junction resolvase
MRILGLDVGERRIGVAISDPLEKIAVPLTTIQRKSTNLAISAIADIVNREGVGALVVGLPVSLDGSLGPQAQEIKAFVQELEAVLPVPLVQWDERYSTAEAERLLREVGYSSRTMRDRRDAVAAAVILQDYMDHKKAIGG